MAWQQQPRRRQKGWTTAAPYQLLRDVEWQRATTVDTRGGAPEMSVEFVHDAWHPPPPRRQYKGTIWEALRR